MFSLKGRQKTGIFSIAQNFLSDFLFSFVNQFFVLTNKIEGQRPEKEMVIFDGGAIDLGF